MRRTVWAEASVVVSEITKSEFDALNIGERCASLWSSKHECGWFRGDAGGVLGILHYDSATRLFGYAVCVSGEEGNHRIGLGADIPREGLARKELLNAMHASTSEPWNNGRGNR